MSRNLESTPLLSVQFYSLLVLNRESLHAYGIKQRVYDITEGRIQLKHATLYESLYAMSDNGLIEESGREEVTGRGRRRVKEPKIRIIYSITDPGRQALNDDIALRRQAIEYFDTTNTTSEES